MIEELLVILFIVSSESLIRYYLLIIDQYSTDFTIKMYPILWKFFFIYGKKIPDLII